jgi:aminoglycoside phosphotransferase (APT) family kinase protein
MGWPTTSTRTPEDLRRRFAGWLGRQLAEARPEVVGLEVPGSNGLSSETLLVDAEWDVDGARRAERLVVRLAPDPAAVPVFPVYDLDRQARIMRLVAAHTDVPVPRVLWSELDAEPLGAPFIVMARVDGQVPPDILPYNFGMSWMSGATPDELERLEATTVDVLARVHAAPDPRVTFAMLDADDGRSPLRRHVDEQRDYYRWVIGESPAPLLERGLDWLDANWPDEPPPVLSWGDSRIGNIIYRDYAPAAVLDWEMATLGPRELDLGWLITLHRFFEDTAAEYGLPGLPQLLRRDAVVARYETLTGYTPRDLDWYLAYAALRHAVIMTRIGLRAVHFGEVERPDSPDELISAPHRAMLEAMLDGRYWAEPAGPGR